MTPSRVTARVLHAGYHHVSGGIGRLKSGLDPVRRPIDRRRYPTEPAAVVIDPEEEPRRLAEGGRSRLFVGSLGRFATCTGVAWLDETSLVTAYLLTGTVALYRSPDGRPPTARLWSQRGAFRGRHPRWSLLVAVSSRCRRRRRQRPQLRWRSSRLTP